MSNTIDSVDKDIEGCSSSLRIGVWTPKTTFWDKFITEFVQQKQPLNIDISTHNDNSSGLLSEDLYNSFARLNNLCLIGTNFNYKTHLDKSTLKRTNDHELSQSDSGDQSPGLSNSVFSYKSDSSCDNEYLDDDHFKIAITFIVITKDTLKGTTFESLKKEIISTIESLRVYNSTLKIILVLYELKNVSLHGGIDKSNTNDSHNSNGDSALLLTPLLNEFTYLLLIQHSVDTIETEDIMDLVKYVVNACSSIDLCFSRSSIMKFKAKPHDSSKEELPLMKKIWITQLLQIPEVGRETAKSIANTYQSPSEIIKEILRSYDKCFNTLKNINLNTKNKRKVGSTTAKRIATLYSYNLVPDCRVYESSE